VFNHKKHETITLNRVPVDLDTLYLSKLNRRGHAELVTHVPDAGA